MQNEGWKCPVCGAGVAPSVLKCEHPQPQYINTPFYPSLIPTCPKSPTGYCTCTGVCLYGFPTYGNEPFTGGLVG